MFVYTVEDIAGLVFVILLVVVLAGYCFIRLLAWMFGGMMYRIWRYNPNGKESDDAEE